MLCYSPATLSAPTLCGPVFLPSEEASTAPLTQPPQESGAVTLEVLLKPVSSSSALYSSAG